MMKIFEWGVSAKFEDYKNQVVVAANKSTFALFALGASSFVISLFFVQELSLVSFLYVLLLGGVFVLNLYYKSVDLSRTLHLAGSVVLISVVHTMAVEPGEPLNEAFYTVQFSLVALPLLFFDFRETGWLIFSMLFALVFFLLQPDLSASMNTNSSLDAAHNSFLMYAFLLAYLLVTGYAIYNFRAIVEENAKKKESVLVQISDTSQQMADKERELQKRISEIKETHSIEEKRSWVAQGISQMIDLMRSKREDVYPALIEEIVKYLGASVGAIYSIKNEEFVEAELVIEGCYAYDRRKYLQLTVPFGDGVIGQSCIDREIVYLENIPPSFLEVQSGLGDEPPRHLAVVPLMEEENIAGVLELASPRAFEEHQKEFLKQLSISIASFILTNTINEKIQLLIEQNQVQAEEMKAQEEEMMQNMEELHATQEEMSRKEKEYISRIEQLEKQLKLK